MWGPAEEEPQLEIRRFGTMTSQLKALAEWLKQADCEIAAMESTGAYWKPVWNVLEGQIGLILANAKHVRALPGEKTDNKDGKRLASFLRHGLIRPSFVPPRDIRELRDLTRYRKKLLASGSGGTEPNSESARRRQYQIGICADGRVRRFRSTHAARAGGQAIAQYRRDHLIGPLEPSAQDRTTEAGIGRPDHGASSFHDRSVVRTHAVHRTTDFTHG
jgi:hypothetical protein